MKATIYFFLIFLALPGLIACSKQGLIKSPSTASIVSGTVIYPKHITLPLEAVVHVILSDVTSPDAPIAFAEQTITRKGWLPILFNINYDSSRINPEHTYSVQACVRFDDQVRFVSTRAYPVITKGHTDKVKILLEPVDTLTDVPKGLWTFTATSKESLTGAGDRSQYEDRYLEALVTMSKYKRKNEKTAFS